MIARWRSASARGHPPVRRTVSIALVTSLGGDRTVAITPAAYSSMSARSSSSARTARTCRRRARPSASIEDRGRGTRAVVQRLALDLLVGVERSSGRAAGALRGRSRRPRRRRRSRCRGTRPRRRARSAADWKYGNSVTAGAAPRRPLVDHDRASPSSSASRSLERLEAAVQELVRLARGSRCSSGGASVERRRRLLERQTRTPDSPGSSSSPPPQVTEDDSDDDRDQRARQRCLSLVESSSVASRLVLFRWSRVRDRGGPGQARGKPRRPPPPSLLRSLVRPVRSAASASTKALPMANTTEVAASAARRPNDADLERVRRSSRASRSCSKARTLERPRAGHRAPAARSTPRWRRSTRAPRSHRPSGGASTR